MWDREITALFDGAGDFIRRPLQCGALTLMTYAIDGLTSGGDISDFVFKPISQQLRGATMQELYENALSGGIYNSVADPCPDPETAAKKLVNGFCVVLFPEVGAIAFEAKTSDKRSPAPPEVENTVKGAKDGFVETGPLQYQPHPAASPLPKTAVFRKHRGAAEPDQRERRLAGRGHQPGTGPENGTAAENH